ncbi:unnamed protein product [Lactuca virosa]|uniref:Uncharacterized protein n=1 Tax=Lactuca virosa TaxID=75947 RepID=A0AAU9NPJ9_9ASTR|nr:unnamed protein product [Lactuca virosa]
MSSNYQPPSTSWGVVKNPLRNPEPEFPEEGEHATEEPAPAYSTANKHPLSLSSSRNDKHPQVESRLSVTQSYAEPPSFSSIRAYSSVNPYFDSPHGASHNMTGSTLKNHYKALNGQWTAGDDYNGVADQSYGQLPSISSIRPYSSGNPEFKPDVVDDGIAESRKFYPRKTEGSIPEE